MNLYLLYYKVIIEDEDDDDIFTTQNPEEYNWNYREYGWELATDGVCPQFCMQCKSNTDCERCKPKHAFLDGEWVSVENCKLLVLMDMIMNLVVKM